MKNIMRGLTNFKLSDYNLSDDELFLTPSESRRQDTYDFTREVSLMKIEVKDLREENKRIKVLETKCKVLKAHNNDLVRKILYLEEVNRKLRKQLKPNILKRMWKKIKKKRKRKYRFINN